MAQVTSPQPLSGQRHYHARATVIMAFPGFSESLDDWNICRLSVRRARIEREAMLGRNSVTGSMSRGWLSDSSIHGPLWAKRREVRSQGLTSHTFVERPGGSIDQMLRGRLRENGATVS